VLILVLFYCLLQFWRDFKWNLKKKDAGNGVDVNGMRDNNKGLKNDKHKWVASLEYILEYILKNEESEQATFLVEELIERLRESGLKIPLWR